MVVRSTAGGTKSRGELREITVRNHEWVVTEPEPGVYVVTEYTADGEAFRAVTFDEVSKFNDRVYYLKLRGETVCRVDTIGSTMSAYIPFVNIASQT